MGAETEDGGSKENHDEAEICRRCPGPTHFAAISHTSIDTVLPSEVLKASTNLFRLAPV
jgi:hypothetical protein